MILRIGVSAIQQLHDDPYTITKIVQLSLIQILTTYLSERDRRGYFLEKQALFDETKVHKEIFELASDGVVIWGIQDGMLYHNWSQEKYRWRNSEKTPQQNFEKIIVKKYKKIGELPSSIVKFCRLKALAKSFLLFDRN